VGRRRRQVQGSRRDRGPYTGDAVVGEARATEQSGDAEKARTCIARPTSSSGSPGRELIATKISAS
jgi:hypothetical protein